MTITKCSNLTQRHPNGGGEKKSEPIDWSQESGGPKDVVFPWCGTSPDGGIFPNLPSLLGQFILFSLFWVELEWL